MKIIIAGAGEVGTHLAKMLSYEKQDIIVLDPDSRRLANLDNYNLMTIQGSAISFDDLKRVGAGSADLFVAVTPFETRNLLACMMAKSMGTKRTVARIDSGEFIQKQHKSFFTESGVDSLIYPEYLAANEIVTALKHTWVRNWFEMLGGELIVVGVKLRANAAIVGHRLRDLGSMSGFLHVNAIKRNRETIIPGGNDVIMENDVAYIATTREHIDRVVEMCGKTKHDVQRVLIMGGNRIAAELGKLIGEKYKVKIIEGDLERCRVLADLLPYCNIVNGDASDTDIMEEEGVGDYDVFVALSDTSERNILSCVMAKELGVNKTVAEVENMQFVAEAESLNIGTIINKQLIASSRIFQNMLDRDVDNAKCLALTDAEVAELEVLEGSKVTRRMVRDLGLSSDMTIAGLVRDGVGHLVNGDTRLLAGDHVVVFCLSGSIHKIEKLFG